MKRYCKLIISVITIALIFIMVLSPCTYAATTPGSQQFKAWVMSALSAINILFTAQGAPVQQVVNFVTDPTNVVYTYSEQQLDEWYDRSVIKINRDSVTIDGVNYTDIWLSYNAAENFRINAFDAKTAFNIASNTGATFAEGAGFWEEYPVFNVNGELTTQTSIIPASPGVYDVPGARINVTDRGTSNYWNINYIDGYITSNYFQKVPYYQAIKIIPTEQPAFEISTNGTTWTLLNTFSKSIYPFVSSPFEFDYVAGAIPADQALPSDHSLRVRVPTSEVQEVLNDYPSLTDPNGVTIDFDSPDITDVLDKLDDLMDIIIPLIPILDIDFDVYTDPEPAPEPEPVPDPDPYPDPAPDPGTVIPDLDWTELFDTLRNIFDKIAQHVSISTAIKNLLDRIKWLFDDLITLVTDLPEAFERHLINTIQTGLNILKDLFAPFFLILKNALGLWHYVVQWVTYISPPFTFMLGIFSYFPAIMYPVYASVAGVLCIAIYKRIAR